MKWICSLICSCFLLTGCLKFFYTSNKNYDGFQCEIPIRNNDYVLYTRTICRNYPGEEFYQFAPFKKKQTAFATWCNCDQTSQTTEILEKQYLLISFSLKKAIYICMYPPFIENGFSGNYLYDRTIFNAPPSFINLWYANKFYFGTLDSNESRIVFKKKKRDVIDYWDIVWSDATKKDLEINVIAIDSGKKRSHTYCVSQVLYNGLHFTKQSSFSIGFQYILDRQFNAHERGSSSVADNKIFVKNCDLYFKLPNGALDPDGNEISWIIFSGNRVATSIF